MMTAKKDWREAVDWEPVIRYRSGWQAPTPPAEPTGGANVDAEARAAVVGLIDALRLAWVFAAE